MLTVIHMMARLVRILMAYVLASFAAGFVFALLSALGGYMRRGRTDLWDAGMTLVMLGIHASTIIGAVALIPAVLVVLFAEATERRSATFYGAAGVGVALLWAGVLMLFGMLFASGYSAVGPFAQGAWAFAGAMLIIGLPGLAGGLMYWLVAGRTAGGEP
jgi:hypothetical protein